MVDHMQDPGFLHNTHHSPSQRRDLPDTIFRAQQFRAQQFTVLVFTKLDTVHEKVKRKWNLLFHNIQSRNTSHLASFSIVDEVLAQYKAPYSSDKNPIANSATQ